jgi:CRISPR-associated protein Cas5t
MKALRIILTQSSANYKKEETVENKMTYPLPPFSTIIGALHSACGYTNYHPMDISIQGKYESMHKEPYVDYCFLNSTQDDRGILVKLKNSILLSTAFDKVAKAKRSQGNSFLEGITIDILNRELLEEYRGLKKLSKEISEFKVNRIDKVLDLIKKRKATLAAKKKEYKSKPHKIEKILKREKQLKELEKVIKNNFSVYRTKEYEIPYSRFATLTTSLKYYEILNNVELIIHIKSDIDTLTDIKNNIYNLKSIGRSEDFVDVKDISFVELTNEIEDEVISEYSSYIDYELVKNQIVNLRTRSGISADGTKYYLNKNYVIEDKKRKFNKNKVVYASKYSAEEEHENIYFDIDKEKTYIVNFN